MRDPVAVSSYAWSEIGNVLHNLWFNLGLAIVLAVLLLTALAIIPSLVSTRQLSPDISFSRLSIGLGALFILGFAILLFTNTLDLIRIMDVFWDRYWI